MFSNSAKYALKAVLFLAINSNENKKIMVKDIAKPINVPQPYIAKLLQELSKQNLISSTRGPKGGFYLNQEDRAHEVLKIITAIDGEKRLTSCLLSLKKCNENKPCPLHAMAYPLMSKVFKNLNRKTIDQLSEDVIAGKSFLPL